MGSWPSVPVRSDQERYRHPNVRSAHLERNLIPDLEVKEVRSELDDMIPCQTCVQRWYERMAVSHLSGIVLLHEQRELARGVGRRDGGVRADDRIALLVLRPIVAGSLDEYKAGDREEGSGPS